MVALSGRGSPAAALDGLADGGQRLQCRFGGRGVRVLVLGQVSFLPEALAAHVAHERFFAGVRAYVYVHRVLVLEPLAAYVTVVQRPFLLGGRRAGRLIVGAGRRDGDRADGRRGRQRRGCGRRRRRSGHRTAADVLMVFRFAVGVVRPSVVLLGRSDRRRRRRRRRRRGRGHLFHRFSVVQHHRGRDL